MTAREKVTLFFPYSRLTTRERGNNKETQALQTSHPRSEEHFKHIGSKASGRKEKLWEGEGSDGALRVKTCAESAKKKGSSKKRDDPESNRRPDNV